MCAAQGKVASYPLPLHVLSPATLPLSVSILLVPRTLCLSTVPISLSLELPSVYVRGLSCLDSVTPNLSLSLPMIWSIYPRPRLGLGLSVLDFGGAAKPFSSTILFLSGHTLKDCVYKMLSEQTLRGRPHWGPSAGFPLPWARRRNCLSVVLLGECKDSRLTRRASQEF